MPRLTRATGLATPRRDTLDQQHAVAIARIAADMATRDSVESVLSAIATELQRVDGVNAVQVILAAPHGGPLRMMGSAGFSPDPSFFDRLAICRTASATLATDEAFRTTSQIVLPDRRRSQLADPTWAAMHSYISEIDWCDFIGTPFAAQHGVRGVINCYLDESMPTTERLLEFLRTLADQASLAVDYHHLIERDRRRVRTEERQRLARDLHDSVIQRVFAIGMHARTLELIGQTRQSSEVLELADEFRQLSESVQRDLRGIVTALQPSAVSELGLRGALERLAAMVRRASGTAVLLTLEGALDDVTLEAADDTYLIVSEAVHNAVRHAKPTTIRIRVHVTEDRLLRLSVHDDGKGFTESIARVGYGLASMRYRASRWGGSLEVVSDFAGRGTCIGCELLALDYLETGLSSS